MYRRFVLSKIAFERADGRYVHGEAVLNVHDGTASVDKVAFLCGNDRVDSSVCLTHDELRALARAAAQAVEEIDAAKATEGVAAS